MIKFIPSLASLLIALWLCHQKARRKWSWGLAAFILPFPTLWILVQLGKSGNSTNIPVIKGWIGRILLVAALCLSLVYIGDSPLVNNKVFYAFQAQIVGHLSPNVVAIDGNIIKTPSRSFAISSFAQAGFALAGLGALCGLCAFRLPVLIILSQSALGFAIGYISSITQQVFAIEMVIREISVDVHRFYKTGFMIGLLILVILSLAIHWWISQKRNPTLRIPSASGDSE